MLSIVLVLTLSHILQAQSVWLNFIIKKNYDRLLKYYKINNKISFKVLKTHGSMILNRAIFLNFWNFDNEFHLEQLY